MSERPWYKRYPSDFIAGTISLNLEEAGAYSYVIDLIHDRGGPIPDDPQWIARVCGCSTRKWKSIRERLIQAGKIYEKDGFISSKRAGKDAETSAKEARKLSENGVKGAEKTNEKIRGLNENNHLTEKGPEKTERHTRSQKPDIEDKQQQPVPSSAKDDVVVWGDDPVAVIKAFDDAIAKHWGDSRRRPWPNPMDRTTAEKFLAAGASADRCGEIFNAVMAPMAGSGKEPPGSLKYFEKIVPQHIGEAAKPLPEVLKDDGEAYASLTDAEQAELRKHIKELIAAGETAEEAARLGMERLAMKEPDDENLIDARPDFLRKEA